MIDVKGGNNLLYLPLDKIMKQQQVEIEPGSNSQQSVATSTPQPDPVRSTTRDANE